MLFYQAAILREELEKTRASLDLSNSKLKLKEELAATAMAAQAAAERSLQLADSRVAGFLERIEELTRQLEEADSRGERSNRRRVRYICWPWRALRVNPAATRTRNVRRMLPEMEALLHYNIWLLGCLSMPSIWPTCPLLFSHVLFIYIYHETFFSSVFFTLVFSPLT